MKPLQDRGVSIGADPFLEDSLVVPVLACLARLSVIATIGYTGASGVALSMPDLSGVSDWPSALAIASGAHGNWTVVANGVSSNASLCSENMRTLLASQSGTF